MPDSQVLPRGLLAQLHAIVPSRDAGVEYYPCSVRLRDGSTHERVYLLDAGAPLRRWGLVPDRELVRAEDIASIEEYPRRLPPAIADRLYAAGESGMGYKLFVLRFRDGTSAAYFTGNDIDFLRYPPGQGPHTVADVQPHDGRDASIRLEGLPCAWCPVKGLQDASGNAVRARPWWKFWASRVG